MSVGKFVSEAWHHIQGQLYSRAAFPVPGRGGRSAGREPPQVRRRAGPRAGRAPSPLRPPRRRASPRRPERAGACLRREGGLGPPDHGRAVDRLWYDPTLRRLCGWCRVSQVPSESTFSRAFAWFAETRLPERMHWALVRAAYDGSVVGHVSRDSTAIVGRERPAPKPKRRRGRPRRGEEAVREPTRLERQLRGGMSTAEMVAELPKACDVGTKRNAKGYKESWRGYRMHIDAADGDVPVSCILTSASLHDSQAAIPLARMTGERVDHCYELMDADCDSREIGAHAQLAGRVATVDANPRRGRGAQGAPRHRGSRPEERGPRPPRPRALQAAVERGAGELRPEGLVRRTPCPGARARQGRLPPVLRRARPYRPAADAARRLTPRQRQRRTPPTPPRERDGAPARTRRAPDGPKSATFRHTPARRDAPETPESGVGTPADAPDAGQGHRNRDNCARGSLFRFFSGRCSLSVGSHLTLCVVSP